MKLTKEQRLDAYVYALFVTFSEGRKACATCFRLKGVYHEIKRKQITNDVTFKEAFPEFVSQKPADLYFSSPWWADGSLKRIKALEKSISECEKSKH